MAAFCGMSIDWTALNEEETELFTLVRSELKVSHAVAALRSLPTFPVGMTTPAAASASSMSSWNSPPNGPGRKSPPRQLGIDRAEYSPGAVTVMLHEEGSLSAPTISACL